MNDRAALVAKAHMSIKRGSKSFAAASRLFDRTTRERVWLLYAWCRAYDGTTVPLTLSLIVLGIGILLLILYSERGRLFRRLNPPKNQ